MANEYAGGTFDDNESEIAKTSRGKAKTSTNSAPLILIKNSCHFFLFSFIFLGLFSSALFFAGVRDRKRRVRIVLRRSIVRGSVAGPGGGSCTGLLTCRAVTVPERDRHGSGAPGGFCPGTVELTAARKGGSRGEMIKAGDAGWLLFGARCPRRMIDRRFAEEANLDLGEN